MEVNNLKSRCFDLIRQKEFLLQKIQQINQEINKLSQEITKLEQPKGESPVETQLKKQKKK